MAPVSLARTPPAAPTLDALAEQPSLVADIPVAECAGLVIRCAGVLLALGARLVDGAKAPAPLAPPLDLETAAPLLGMQPDTLRRRAKTDPAYRALVFDNGTDRLFFDPDKLAAFRRRRTG